MKKAILALTLLALPFNMLAQNQEAKYKIKRWYLPFQVNSFDKNKEYHGRWKVYINNDKDLIRSGRFKHGKETGTWRYYYPSGTLYMVEKYKRNSPVVQVRCYHENGKLAKAGTAKFYNTDSVAHYYWEGDWKIYDEQGNFSHNETYLKGNLLKYKD